MRDVDNRGFFEDEVNKQIGICHDVLIGKAAEYATIDRFHNFNVAAAMQGCTPREALYGMMAKHTASIYDMKTGDYSLERWTEKITDSINYLLILKAMVAFEKEDTDQIGF